MAKRPVPRYDFKAFGEAIEYSNASEPPFYRLRAI